jgi:hypothetical protein
MKGTNFEGTLLTLLPGKGQVHPEISLYFL